MPHQHRRAAEQRLAEAKCKNIIGIIKRHVDKELS
jgi:hypothetical protein